MRDIRGNEISMIFQEPMTSLNPVLTDRPADRARRCGCTRASTAQAAAKRAVEMLRLVGIPEPRAARAANIRTSSPAACASA